MSWAEDGKSLDDAVDGLIDKVFVKDSDAFLKAESGNVEVSGELEPLYAIQAYVTSGLVYPTTDEAFKKDVPESAFDPLKTVLPDLYSDTKKSILGVARSCDTFNKELLNKLLSYPNLMITYADTAINLLEDEEEGLLKQIKVLTDRKYDKAKDLDDDFSDATAIAKNNLELLREKAKEKKEESESLKSKLEAFLTETKANKILVDTANAHYSQAITIKDKKYDTPIAYLDADLADLEKAEQNALKDKEKWEKEKGKYNDPGDYHWWVKQFTSPGGLLSTEVGKIHQKAVDKLADAKSDKSKVYSCRKYVMSMSSQFKGLLPRMTAAIAALNSLAMIFNSQVRNIELLIDSFQRIEKGTSSTVGAVRRSDFRSGIKYAIENYKKVKTSALDFEKNARFKVKVEGK